MNDRFSRTGMLLGKNSIELLKASRVAVFGIGGVGSYTAEALIRSGLGRIDVIDNDRVCLSNLNRQLFAVGSTVGKYKVDAAAERIADINPEAVVYKHNMFYSSDTADQLDFSEYDYIVDAIDTVAGKIEIVVNAAAAGIPVISSMGAGNKLDPSAFRVADIYKTSVCPLARVMRTELKKRGIKALKTVYSTELPIKSAEPDASDSGRKAPGSISFVPSVAGLIIAGEVIKDLTGIRGRGTGV